MSKKKGKNSNYKGEVDTKGLPFRKEEAPEKSFFQKYQNIIIISICAVLAIALIVGIILVLNPRNDVFVEFDFGDYGKIVVEIDREAAPITADNFISLVESGFYNGLAINRGEPGFVIQGGENKNTDTEPIKGEFYLNGYNNPISHKRGVISMARDDFDSATSQFFIVLDDSAATDLDGAYAAFGYVFEGMDVADKIAEELYKHKYNDMGFVNDEDAITIVSAKIVNYN